MFRPFPRPLALAIKHSALLGALVLAGCSYIPFISPRAPDLTPAHDSAENLVRLDATMRSGCASVTNIERPTAARNSTAPQRWIAHTCNGDIFYDVVTVKSSDGPIVKVLPVPSPLNTPANPNAQPATPSE